MRWPRHGIGSGSVGTRAVGRGRGDVTGDMAMRGGRHDMAVRRGRGGRGSGHGRGTVGALERGGRGSGRGIGRAGRGGHCCPILASSLSYRAPRSYNYPGEAATPCHSSS